MKRLAVDPYCYPGTNILRNLPDIRDAHLLEITESALTASQSVVVESTSRPPHDLDRLLLIHRTLFGKLYPFAGKLREHTGTMAKVRAARAGHFYGELDAVHPFREGNSRTLRLFFSGLAQSAGYRFDWHAIASALDGRDRLYAARDRAVMHADSSPLTALFATILSPR